MFLTICILVLSLFALSPTTHATRVMAQRALLEQSIPCYQRYAPGLWNAFVLGLDAKVTSDVDKLAQAAATLRALLRARLPPCTALTRALGGGSVACPPQVTSTDTGPLIMCLSGVGAAARGALFETAAREKAMAANAQMATTREEAITFGTKGAADYDYSDPVTKEVLAKIHEKKKRNQ